MKRLLIVLVSILIMVVGGVGIILLFDPSLLNIFEKTTTSEYIEVSEDYTIINQTKNVIGYVITTNINEEFDIKLGDVKIKYNNDSLYINDNEITSEISIYDRAAIYSNRFVVLLYSSLINDENGFIIYDLFKRDFKIVNEIDDMPIVINDEIYFTDVGFDFKVSLIKDNTIRIKDKKEDLCKYKNSEMIVEEDISYIYNNNDKVFDDYEAYTFISAESIIARDNLCD